MEYAFKRQAIKSVAPYLYSGKHLVATECVVSAEVNGASRGVENVETFDGQVDSERVRTVDLIDAENAPLRAIQSRRFDAPMPTTDVAPEHTTNPTQQQRRADVVTTECCRNSATTLYYYYFF